MWRTAGTRALIVAALALAACGSSEDGGAPTTTAGTTTSTTTSTTSTTSTAAPTTTVPTTAAPTTTVLVDGSIPSLPTTSTLGVDTDPPPAPTNVTCAPGGGSQEVFLEWDAPADPDDIVDVRFYVNDGSGFARVNKFTLDSGQVLVGANRWSAVAYPVPVDTEIKMAVTLGDAAGNESGWNPIDVYYEYSGADCVN
jgi:hypothetical protein